MSIVYIGIGSNLGDRQYNCRRAIELLEGRGLTITKSSSMHETEPWGIKKQPRFINMAVEVETDLPPAELLVLLRQIEKAMGREYKAKWGPRIIDLDILLYNDLRLTAADLSIPHPLMHKREFVLRPLSEIAPEKTHPVLSKNIRELLQALINEDMKTL